MSELREDPITGRRSIIAPHRSSRPNDYPRRPPPAAPADCPFCEGHESWTPPEIVADRPAGRPANGPGWTVRAIPNKFPSVSTEARLADGLARDDRGVRRPGFGFHEVILESPVHDARLATLPAGQVRRVLGVLRDRVRALESEPSIASLIVFENSGPESGGTLFHPHAQIVALSEVLPVLAEETAAAERYARDHDGRCVFEETLASERGLGTRVVREERRLTAYCPFASEHPYEVRIVPHRHAGSFGDASEEEVDALARLLPAVLSDLEEIVPEYSYNFALRSFARGRPERGRYHWHLDVLPRLLRPDGFDVGGGIPVNPFAPETAARELRGAGREPGRPERGPGEVPKE